MTTLLNYYSDSVEFGSGGSIAVKIKVKKKMKVSAVYFYTSSNAGSFSVTPLLKNASGGELSTGSPVILSGSTSKWWRFPINEIELQANVDYWICLNASGQCKLTGKNASPIDTQDVYFYSNGTFFVDYISNPNPYSNATQCVGLDYNANTAPSITVTNNNQTVSPAAGRSIITLSGTATDADNDAITISATIDGKTKSVVVTGETGTTKPWSLTWGVHNDNITQGSYSNIVISASDGAGGTASATYTGTITVDKTNPVITISGVANGVTYQNSVAPTFSATDAGGSALSSVTATLNGVAYTSGTAITTSGSKTLVVKAIDNAGNESQQTVTFAVNKTPTINLTSPSDNQTLSEGNTMAVQGSVTDADANDPVTIYLQINNGTILAVDSKVSDGTTAIPFAKTLTYKNKRVYSGTTDLVGVDLAENTDHTLKVWAEDNKQGKSTEVIRKFRIIWNRPPVIDGENRDLGSFMQIPTVNYSATDPEGNTFTFSEYLNGKQIRSFAGVAGQQYTVEISHDAWIRLDLDMKHQIKIVATDSAGISSERIYTFTRKETHIEFLLNFDNPDVQGHFILDGMPLRVLVTLERYIPEGATIESVKVCNNALDAVPTWEDCTGAIKGNRGYLFTNKTKTAANWAINVWVVIAKGTATERVRLNGYGGAFD